MCRPTPQSPRRPTPRFTYARGATPRPVPRRTPVPLATDVTLDDGRAGVLIAVKAIPGASRDQVAGRLGDRLKGRIAAAPEGGKANRAICALLAAELGIQAGDVEVVGGHGRAEKTVRVLGAGAAAVEAKWPA